jgi:hypothetical protein
MTCLYPFSVYPLQNPLPQSTVNVLDKFLGKSGSNPSPVSPKGEKLMPPETKIALLRKINITINRLAPFPFGKGGG